MGVALGAGYMYETTFEKEVYSDLTGERGVLMGAIAGIFQAQYDVLRANGKSQCIWYHVIDVAVDFGTSSLHVFSCVQKTCVDHMTSSIQVILHLKPSMKL